jgi:hypothetical protein
MSDKKYTDPMGILSEVYETMYEQVADNLHKAKRQSSTLVRDLIEEAVEKVVKVEGIAADDAEKLATWLRRDFDDVINYVSETDYAVKDWLGFETSLIKNELIKAMLDTADKTTLALLRMKENAHKPYDYHTGEVTGLGTLICDECGEKLHFHKAGHIPPCPKCHNTSFHRIQIE